MLALRTMLVRLRHHRPARSQAKSLSRSATNLIMCTGRTTLSMAAAGFGYPATGDVGMAGVSGSTDTTRFEDNPGS